MNRNTCWSLYCAIADDKMQGISSNYRKRKLRGPQQRESVMNYHIKGIIQLELKAFGGNSHRILSCIQNQLECNRIKQIAGVLRCIFKS